MNSFLSAAAQISFTVTGLVALAIASDKETRSYWFQDKKRRVEAYATLYLVILPGFVSILSLIPIPVKSSAWPFASILGSVILFILWQPIKSNANGIPLKQPEKIYWLFTFLFVAVGITNLLTKLNLPQINIALTEIKDWSEVFFSAFISIAILTGAIYSAILLSQQIEPNRQQEITPTKIPEKQKIKSPKNEKAKNLTSLSVLLAIVLFFLWHSTKNQSNNSKK